MNKLIVGIDFGTTNTVISFWNSNKPNILNDGIYKTIPSKIFISDKTYCGNYIPLKAVDIIHSFKIQKDNKPLFAKI
jgi:molecular chaperone DnaK (HSP70)